MGIAVVTAALFSVLAVSLRDKVQLSPLLCLSPALTCRACLSQTAYSGVPARESPIDRKIVTPSDHQQQTPQYAAVELTADGRDQQPV